MPFLRIFLTVSFIALLQSVIRFDPVFSTCQLTGVAYAQSGRILSRPVGQPGTTFINLRKKISSNVMCD